MLLPRLYLPGFGWFCWWVFRFWEFFNEERIKGDTNEKKDDFADGRSFGVVLVRYRWDMDGKRK